MFTGIEHFAIASSNPKILADWYVEHLEFHINYEYGGNYFVKAKNGFVIEIIPSEGDRGPNAFRTPGLRHIAISVENFDAAYAALKDKGVSFLGEPYMNQTNRLVFFTDPEGNQIHLIERETPLP
jgi:glyoxylase I family protein